jgi:hypothetical protein
MIRRTYDTNNEQALLKFGGPHRYLTSAPSFNGVIDPQGVQITRAIKYGNIRIYGTPQEANDVEEEETQNDSAYLWYKQRASPLEVW